ncbi:MAG: type II toxin-antitoxin system mRNA interferase toxin, RelE/StbE family [Candidatus Margulisbacteria bacterium]|jgi:addiction module RelE/StbE family toxin|nr:type II toxin-antitoxin system mRNA interferase toxin, RelE/StbE family [Candidatus Margulisiibacteriota bacterium]
MRVEFSKNFEKEYRKLRPGKQDKVDAAIGLFLTDHAHPQLRKHALTGEWLGHYSISAGGDLRLHFKLLGGLALFVSVGTHAQLYG